MPKKTEEWRNIFKKGMDDTENVSNWTSKHREKYLMKIWVWFTAEYRNKVEIESNGAIKNIPKTIQKEKFRKM